MPGKRDFLAAVLMMAVVALILTISGLGMLVHPTGDPRVAIPRLEDPP